MRSHDDIRQMFPDLLDGRLAGPEADEVKEHAQQCAECRDELALLTGLRGIEVPDPGNIFWNTLPKKVLAAGVRPAARRRRIVSWWSFLGPLPAAAAVAALVLLVSRPVEKTQQPYQEALFSDPLAVAMMDYSLLTDKDIPLIDAEIAPEELAGVSEDMVEEGYHRELVSLNYAEVELLDEALQDEQQKGG